MKADNSTTPVGSTPDNEVGTRGMTHAESLVLRSSTTSFRLPIAASAWTSPDGDRSLAEHWRTTALASGVTVTAVEGSASPKVVAGNVDELSGDIGDDDPGVTSVDTSASRVEVASPQDDNRPVPTKPTSRHLHNRRLDARTRRIVHEP